MDEEDNSNTSFAYNTSRDGEEEEGNYSPTYGPDSPTYSPDAPTQPLSKEYRKRVRLVKKDRISVLDNNVLTHILSFLSTIDTVKTCVLSKRWRNVWTHVPCFSFILESDSLDTFVELVNNALIRNKCSRISKFHIDLEILRWDRDEVLDPRFVDFWIGYATKENVEDMSLYLDRDICRSQSNTSFSLPSYVYTCSSLTRLNLSYCDISPHGVVTWTNLKSLSIKKTELSESTTENILSGSPALEVMEMLECSGLSCLDINSASLRKLVIRDYWSRKNIGNEYSSRLVINAPHIKELEISGICRTKFRLGNVSSLVTAHFGFRLNGVCHIEESQKMLRDILYAVLHVRELILEEFCFQSLTALLKVKSLFCSLLNCKVLTLKALILREREVLGLPRLLQFLPHLEILIIDPSTCECNYDDDDYESEKTLNSKNLLMRDLKTIKIIGSHACNEKQIIALAEYLLKNARALETMSFGVSKWCAYNNENLLKVAQKLLILPRSSPHANIMFSW